VLSKEAPSQMELEALKTKAESKAIALANEVKKEMTRK
jgi:hypothetical protein